MGILIQLGQICVLIALLSDERGKRLKKTNKARFVIAH